MQPHASSASGVACREDAIKIRDRVLLYARGLDLAPVLAVELALESMRRTGLERACAAGPDGSGGALPGLPEVMDEFHRLLERQEQSLILTDEGGAPLASMPPLNKRPMLPGEMDRSPIRRVLKRLKTLLAPSPAKLS